MMVIFKVVVSSEAVAFFSSRDKAEKWVKAEKESDQIFIAEVMGGGGNYGWPDPYYSIHEVELNPIPTLRSMPGSVLHAISERGGYDE